MKSRLSKIFTSRNINRKPVLQIWFETCFDWSRLTYKFDLRRVLIGLVWLRKFDLRRVLIGLVWLTNLIWDVFWLVSSDLQIWFETCFDWSRLTYKFDLRRVLIGLVWLTNLIWDVFWLVSSRLWSLNFCARTSTAITEELSLGTG